MDNAVTVTAPPPAATGFGLIMSPQTIKDTRDFCEMLARTDFVPKPFRGKPDSIMVVGAMGARLGVDVFTAMAGIADINGRPSVYGDLMLALCMQHPLFEDCIETVSGEPYKDNFTATCVAKRKGREPVVRSFSVVEAKEAGLWKKPGPWTATPQRMLQMRARSFALRDTFPDKLAGFHSREEMEDVREVEAEVVATTTEPRPARRRTVKDDAAPAAAGPDTAAMSAHIREQIAAKEDAAEQKPATETTDDRAAPLAQEKPAAEEKPKQRPPATVESNDRIAHALVAADKSAAVAKLKSINAMFGLAKLSEAKPEQVANVEIQLLAAAAAMGVQGV